MPTIRPFKKIYLSQVSSEIPASKPIVFWDTCSLLYILTIAVRDSFVDYPFYKEILGWIENEDVISVTSSIVWDEFNDHYTDILSDANKDVDKLRALIRNYADIQVEPIKSELNTLANSIDLISILDEMESRVWKKTYVIIEERSLADLAHYRVMHKLSPSLTKDQYKDAYIWCTFMSVAQQFLAETKLFMTDNTEDYCIGKKSYVPQSQIKLDCTTVNAKTIFKIGSLRGELYQALHP